MNPDTTSSLPAPSPPRYTLSLISSDDLRFFRGVVTFELVAEAPGYFFVTDSGIRRFIVLRPGDTVEIQPEQ